MLILNDLHIAVNRTGGTTPQSLQALRDYLRDSLTKMLDTEDFEVAINGDLFDGFSVDTVEVIKVYEIFADWLGVGQRRKLNLCRGNHDWNPRSDKLSSFQLLCHFLTAHFKNQVKVFDTGFEQVYGNVYCIPHMPNQVLWDLEIDKAIAFDGTGQYLLLHANFKNGHAEDSLHSLNANDAQIGALMKAGWHTVFAHEHIGGEFRSGRVIIVGCNFPSSVSDCIGDPTKHALIIDGTGHRLVETWEAFSSYTEIDWRELAAGTAAPDDHQFIRITGDATALESAEVIRVVSTLRQRHHAFVITNSVRVEGQDMVSDMADQTVEDIKAFDVLNAIFSELEPDEIACVKGLLT